MDTKQQQQLIEQLKAISRGVADMQETQRSIAKRLDTVEARTGIAAPAEDGLESRFAGPVAHFNGVDHEKEKFSFSRAIMGIAYNNWGRGFEKHVFDESRNVREKLIAAWSESGMVVRDMGASTDSLGGYWVPPQVLAAEFIPLLRANLVVEAAGADVMENLVGAPVTIPKESSAVAANWVGENAEGTAGDIGTGQLELNPHEVLAATKLSNRLLRLGVSVEARVRDHLAKSIRLALDLAALRGTGGASPVGVAQIAGINTVAIGTNGGSFTFDIAAKMRRELATDNALDGRLGYISHPLVFHKMRTERIAQFSGDTAGQYVMLPMTDEQMRANLGWPFYETTQLPVNLTKGSSADCGEAYFGNWEDLVLALWGGLDLFASPAASDSISSAFLRNQTWVRAIMEADVGLKRAESFCVVSDARTN